MRIFIVTLLCVLLIACSKVNRDNYEKIKSGMAMDEVYSLLGEPTDKTTKGIGSFSGTSAKWQKGGITITVIGMNGKVQSKTYNEEKAK